MVTSFESLAKDSGYCCYSKKYVSVVSQVISICILLKFTFKTMASGAYFTPSSISLFVALGIIRGSFSVVIYFADRSFKSPSLVFLLRTPGTVLLYIFLAIYLASKDGEIKQIFTHNMRNVRNYFKSAIMGFVQLAAPYLLFMYGLKVLSPTAGGVFMAAAPWLTTLLERFPCIQVSYMY